MSALVYVTGRFHVVHDQDSGTWSLIARLWLGSKDLGIAVIATFDKQADAVYATEQMELMMCE